MNAPQRIAQVSAAERQVRVELAAAFRIADKYGWNEGVANHFSVSVPGEADRYLVNPRGMHFAEAAPSRFLKVDGEGRILAGEGQLRPVAFHLHGRLHAALPQARCILHAHPPYATAITMMRGMRMSDAHQISMPLFGRIVYDDHFGGPVDVAGEADRLVELARPETRILMHAMHGVTALGPTVADAYDALYKLERLARYQVRALSAGVPLNAIPPDIAGNYRHDGGLQPSSQQLHLDAVMRLLDRDQPGWRD